MSPQISQSAGMRRDDICICVSPSNRTRLAALVGDRNTPCKVVWRAEIVLATADGHGTNEIMRRTGMSKPCFWRWQERYIDEGVEGLMRDKTRPSRKPPLPEKIKLAVLTKTANETPANATHWSRASMAAEMGISPSSVGRIWAEAGLKPHLVRRFKISNDPQFEEKITDVVRRYMNPPDRALVLCVDEKSQIQALDRTQPGSALEEGPRRDDDARLQAPWHDYAVRSARRQERPRHRRMPAAASGAGVHPLPEADRPMRAEAPRRPPRARQLRDAQDARSEGVAR
jgi:transposase